MGDTGSLAIGGTIGVVSICCKQELLLTVVGGVFVIEAVSVILQVFSFKLTGKRLFAMSPIHHHFELSGWKENTVIVRFWISFDRLRAPRSGHSQAAMNPDYKNKNVAVLGAGRSGKAAALLLAEEGAKVTMLDSAPEENWPGLEPVARARCLSASSVRWGVRSTVYDLGIYSPGIDPELALARNFSRKNIPPAIGELELGWQFCRVPVIGITGTNGKTTTTELTARMLNACGQRTVACGNIGKPLVEMARESDDLAVLTVEVSSFQLETIREFHPEISVWLNFAPDHLDRYRSIREYREAKLRIFEKQTPDDTAVINASEEVCRV